ncbi:MAG: hypothetical protein PHR35_09180 [Kiritimatiellae bacterium]|nr:hypothetical protein [Kiritimatiellia bacterium]
MNTRNTIGGGIVLLFLAGVGNLWGQSNTGTPELDSGGVWLGPLNISPFLNASVLYDSNVDFVREGEEDTLEGEARDKDTRGFCLQPGVDLMVPGNGWQLDGRAYYQLEDYSAESAESREDWSETLSWYWESDAGTGLRLSEMMQQVTHDDTDFADRWNDRNEMRFSGDFGRRLTEKTDIGLVGYYHELTYDDEQLFDWERYGGSLTMGLQLTDKTDGLLVGGVTSHSSEDQDGSAESLCINAGFASRATEKTAYRTTIGVERYTGFEDDDSQTGLSYDLGLSWRAADYMMFNLSGRSSYEPAEDVGQNSMLVSTIGANMNYRPMTRWELMVGGAYRREDYINKIEVTDMAPTTVDVGGESRTDDQLSGQARIVYGVNQYASLFLGGVYTYTVSSIDEFDYTRWRLNAGVALRY